VRITVSTPHGPIELDDGRLVYLGHCTLDGKGAVAVDESASVSPSSSSTSGAAPTGTATSPHDVLLLQNLIM